MSYTATITSRIVQFGTTEIMARFTDNAGVMPERFMNYSWPKENISQAEILAARNEIIQRLIQEYQDDLAEKAKMAAFIEKAKDWLDNKISIIQSDYLEFVNNNNNLTEPQKELARKVVFEWRMK